MERTVKLLLARFVPGMITAGEVLITAGEVYLGEKSNYKSLKINSREPYVIYKSVFFIICYAVNDTY